MSIDSRVYVGNIDWKITDAELKDHMASAGDVVRAEIFTDGTGRSKGVGLVYFETPQDAAAAIDKMNDSMLGERMIFVREDRKEGKGFKGEKGDDKGKGRKGYDKGYGKSYDKGYGKSYDKGFEKGEKGKKGKGKGIRVGPGDRGRVIYVGNLPPGTPWQKVKDLFRKHGNVIRVEMPLDSDTGESRGHGQVLFETEEDAQGAIQALNQTDFEGRSMVVRLDNHL
eukprot:CAMPEP_0114674720 /NCGR_PEP_ID=MMETSP0191-20121206/46833_1 /TAXON_ID=126664 /ORGANISM="Sorites sp." /LENGTH=224 /DNA_ID=CAMNT_0001942631 /DNA_START=50 /DNA_END=724 /DNA_ORIENTATION=+